MALNINLFIVAFCWIAVDGKFGCYKAHSFDGLLMKQNFFFSDRIGVVFSLGLFCLHVEPSLSLQGQTIRLGGGLEKTLALELTLATHLKTWRSSKHRTCATELLILSSA